MQSCWNCGRIVSRPDSPVCTGLSCMDAAFSGLRQAVLERAGHYEPRNKAVAPALERAGVHRYNVMAYRTRRAS